MQLLRTLRSIGYYCSRTRPAASCAAVVAACIHTLIRDRSIVLGCALREQKQLSSPVLSSIL